MKYSIIMPVYNEENNIKDTVIKCYNAIKELNLHSEIIVVNDGSNDMTGTILKDLKKEFKILKVVTHTSNKGYGKSIIDGINFSKYEFIITVDSDGQFDFNDLSLFINKINLGFDVIIGHRDKKKDSMLKVIANKILNKYVNIIFKNNFKDLNCAFRLYKREVINSITLESTNFILPTEILLKLSKLNYNIFEIKVNHLYRQKGKSSIKLLKNAKEMLSFLSYLRNKMSLYDKNIINIL